MTIKYSQGGGALRWCQPLIYGTAPAEKADFCVTEAPGDWMSPPIPKRPWTLARILGIDHRFSRGDRWITGTLFTWAVAWFTVMLLGSAWNLLGQSGLVPWIRPWSNEAWLGFWHVTAIGLPIFITVITGLWFTWGGIHDIRALFRSLKSYRIDDSDNGTVKEHKPF